MVREALTNYLSLASGLTEVTRQRARTAARALVAQGEATVEQVSGLAQEILETSRTNRNALVNLVRYEVDRAFGQVGLATSDDLSGLQRRVADLEKSIRELTAAVAEYEQGTGPAPTTEPPPEGVKAAKTTAKASRTSTTGKRAAGKTTGAKGAAGPSRKLDAPKKAAAKAGRAKTAAGSGRSGAAGAP